MNWGNTKVYNFYSSGEEVMGNIPPNKGNNLADILDAAKFSWGCQEKLKGRMPGEFLGSTIAGWGFNQDDYGDWDLSGDPIWLPETPASAETISPTQLATQPFFKKSPIDLFSSNPATAQNYAQEHYYDLLSRAIPARTYGVGANPLDVFEHSEDMQSMQPSGWPSSRTTTDWHHSDCRDVAYLFTHKLFESIVNLGELK
jgi:hypothetical protein